MRILLLLTLLAAASHAANVCVLTNNTGAACATKACSLSAIAADTAHTNWTGAGCTANGYVPAAPDSIAVPDTYSLTADQNWTIGASGAINTTPALHLNKSGVLNVSGGATLRARGDVVYTDPYPGPYPSAVVAAGGSHFVFDSSQASSPTTTRYRYGEASGGGAGRFFEADGTSGSHVTVTSDPTNGALPGQFRSGLVGIALSGSAVYTNQLEATYTDFSHIGDATANGEAFSIGFYGGLNWTFSITHCTFDYVGPTAPGAGDLTSTSPLNFDYNVFTHSAGYSNILLPVNAAATGGTARSVSHNVFDKPWNTGNASTCDGGVTNAALTFVGNYFGDRVCAGDYGSTVAQTSTDNFYRVLNAAVGIGGNTTGGYLFNDATGASNWHALTATQVASVSMSGLVAETPDDAVTDSGELLVQWYFGGPTTYLTNVVMVPSKTGSETQELISDTGGSATTFSVSVSHNTWVGGYHAGAFGAVQVNETAPSGGPLTAFQSNLLWSAGGGYCKVETVEGGAGQLLVNPVTTADYNSMDQYGLANAVSSGCLATCSNTVCTNQGNGYISPWTTTPGVHDIVAEPRLADAFLRNVALWDTRYLGNAAGVQWTSSHGYSVGDTVSDHYAGYWQGSTVNFRCILAHTSSSSDEPNTGVNWRTYWEFESLYDLRTAIAGSTAYTDGAIGCISCTAIQALTKWVQAGFTPSNPALWCAGHDGETTGAVPFCSKGKALISAAGM